MTTRQRRVTLALKWHHLDNLSVEEIQERFEQEGIGSYVQSTIRDYLNDDPAEEVIEQIEQEHANVRLQIAEREERMFQRARDAEADATEDEPIVRVVPKTDTVDTDREGPMQWPAWEIVEPGDPDRPEWADERDVIIRFTNETRELYAGERYPLRELDGSPKYTKEFDGLRREQDDLKGQAMARSEQSKHLEAKGEALGVYSTDINMQVDGDVDHSVELDEETAAAIREATLDDE
jgi:NAD-dependent DNA ligase